MVLLDEFDSHYQNFNEYIRRHYTMKLKIIRIENRIVTCQLDDGTIIDIARRWFTEDIREGDTIDITVCNCTNKSES